MKTARVALGPLALLSACFAHETPPPAPAMPMSPARDVAAPTMPSPPTPLRGGGAAGSGKRTIVRAGRVLDVRTGKILLDQAIAIEDDKIVRVASASTVAPGAGTTVIDLPNATVLPGLIDMHTHLTFNAEDGMYESLGISLPREALSGAKNGKLTLEAGFTTVRNLGAGGFSDVALRQAFAEGDLPGPRLVASGLALGITGGHCDNDLLPFDFHSSLPNGVADGVEHVQHKVRENIKFGADVIKVCATGGVLSLGDDPQASQYSLEELKAIVADAHRLGRRVAAHAHGAEGIRFAAEAGVDSIEHGTYIDDRAIAIMKAKGTYLVPTLWLGGDYLVENAEKHHTPPAIVEKIRATQAFGQKSRARAFAAGVRFAFGTDAGVYPHGRNAGEFAELVKIGMTPLQAIQSATVNAADLLGWSDKLGALDTGKWADLIAVDGDPLKDVSVLERVRFVMKSGSVYKNDYATPPSSEAAALRPPMNPPLYIPTAPAASAPASAAPPARGQAPATPAPARPNSPPSASHM